MTWEEFGKVARRKFEENQISEIEKLNESKRLQNIAMQKAKQILSDKKLRSDAEKLAEQIRLKQEQEKKDAEEKKRKKRKSRNVKMKRKKNGCGKEEERKREEEEAGEKKSTRRS